MISTQRGRQNKFISINEPQSQTITTVNATCHVCLYRPSTLLCTQYKALPFLLLNCTTLFGLVRGVVCVTSYCFIYVASHAGTAQTLSNKNKKIIYVYHQTLNCPCCKHVQRWVRYKTTANSSVTFSLSTNLWHPINSILQHKRRYATKVAPF